MTAKVQALAETLRSVGIPANNARRLDESGWIWVAFTAEVNSPTEDEKRAVYAALEEMAKCR